MTTTTFDPLTGSNGILVGIVPLVPRLHLEFSATYDTVATFGPPTEEDPDIIRVNVTGKIPPEKLLHSG